MKKELIAKMDLTYPIKHYTDKYINLIEMICYPEYWYKTMVDKIYEDILNDNPEIDKTSKDRELFREEWIIESEVRLAINWIK